MKKLLLVTILSTLAAGCAPTPSPVQYAPTAAASPTPFVPQFVWKSTDDKQSPPIQTPIAMNWGKDGNLWVLDSAYPRVLKFNRDGAYVGMISFTRGSGEGQFGNNQNEGGDLAMDNQGNFYIPDPGNVRVQKFDSDGKFLLAFGKQGTGDGEFNLPIGLSVDTQANVFVNDYKSSVVQKFDGNGKFISKFGSPGKGQGQFTNPGPVGVDVQGNIYVGDSRIQKFDQNGKFISEWLLCASTESVSTLVSPSAIAFDRQGNVYVADYDGNHICKFDRDGNRLMTWGTKGSGDGQFNKPAALAVDDGDNVYVGDLGNRRIQKFRQH